MAVASLAPPQQGSNEPTKVKVPDLDAVPHHATNAVAFTDEPATVAAGTRLGAIGRHAASAVASTVSLAKPATDAAGAGLGFVGRHAATAVASTASLAKPAAVAAGSGLGFVGLHAANAVASTASLAKPANVAAGLGAVGRHAAAAVSTREGAVKTAAVVLGGAVGAYFLWPAAAVAGATMKAPGATGFFISRAAFAANPQHYFYLLRTAGAAVAAAAFV